MDKSLVSGQELRWAEERLCTMEDSHSATGFGGQVGNIRSLVQDYFLTPFVEYFMRGSAELDLFLSNYHNVANTTLLLRCEVLVSGVRLLDFRGAKF